MSVLVLVLLLVAVFELVWSRSAALRPYRWHFRGMLAMFWSVVLLIAAGSWLDVLPGLYFQGVPRFASDAATYQAQAAVLADRLRGGVLAGFLDHQFFNYSRVLALLNIAFGENPVVGGVFNAVFYMASTVAVFLIGRELFGNRAGLVAAWLLACSPTLLLHDSQTLRWAATTAGLHVAVLGMLLLTGARWALGSALVVLGFAVLVSDLPYVSRLFWVVVALYAVVIFFFTSLGRDRLRVGVRVAAAAMVLTVWYQWAWSAPFAPSQEEELRARLEEVVVRRERLANVSEFQRVETGSGRVANAGVARKSKLESSQAQRELSELDRLVAPVLLARTGFLEQAQVLRDSGIQVGTAIEAEELATFREFMGNLPSALLVALTEPTIPRLLSDANGSSRLRQLAVFEMLLYYVVTAMALWGLWLAAKASAHIRIRVAFVVLLVGAAYVLLGTSILNGGTLHRLRQPYVGLLCVFTAAAVVELAGRSRRDQHQRAPRSEATAGELMGPKVLLSIPNTLSTRNILRTDTFEELRAAAGRIIIVAPFADEPWFREEFAGPNIAFVRMPRYSPGLAERRLFSALYNLYLAGPAPHSLQLFLNRWADNHPSIGWLRLALTRGVLPILRGITPHLEALFSRYGETAGYADLVSRERPDVAVFSRLFFCDEIPLMRAAVQAGVPTVGIVASWDNLTTKGPLLPRMGRLLVWNDLLKDEAVRYHAYRPEDVTVTGAPQHDIVFTKATSFAGRAEFFARLGLDPAKKLITYAGEDPIIAPDAPRYVEEIASWVRNDRFSMPCQLLVRPHPQDEISHYDSIRNLPGVVFDLPGTPSRHYWMDMSRRDLVHLCETLMHSDVIANVTSTIVVDAAFFDTPSVCIGYGYTHPKTHFNSPMRFFEMDHFRHVIDDRATRVVENPEQLRECLDRYLLDPGLDRDGRARIAARISQFSDGRSGRRTAAAILRDAQRAGWQPARGEGRSTAGRIAREGAI